MGIVWEWGWGPWNLFLLTKETFRNHIMKAALLDCGREKIAGKCIEMKLSPFWRDSNSANGLGNFAYNTLGGGFKPFLLSPLFGCFRKLWYPQIIHFNRVFHYKPSILGYPYFSQTSIWGNDPILTNIFQMG